MLISLDEAQKIITPDIASGLAYCSGKAYEDWFNEVTDNARARCTAIAKSAFINDHMISYAQEIFKDSNDVKIIPVHGRYQLKIKDCIIFKLKKLNRNYMPSNIPTKTVICFNSQLIPPVFDIQLNLMPIEDDITHLLSGYVENSLKTKMQPYIVCPNGKSPHWIWQIGFTPQPVEPITTNPDNNDGSYGLNPKQITPKTHLTPEHDILELRNQKDAEAK